MSESPIPIPIPCPLHANPGSLHVSPQIRSAGGSEYWPQSKNTFARNYGGWFHFLIAHYLNVWNYDDLQEAERIKRILEDHQVDKDQLGTEYAILLDIRIQSDADLVAEQTRKARLERYKRHQKEWVIQMRVRGLCTDGCRRLDLEDTAQTHEEMMLDRLRANLNIPQDRRVLPAAEGLLQLHRGDHEQKSDQNQHSNSSH